MMKQATIDQLKAMKFTAMANAFAAQGADPVTYGQMGFEERFGLLVDAEWNRRQQNKLRSRIQEARLDTPSAVMECICRSNCAPKPARLSIDSAGIEQGLRPN